MRQHLVWFALALVLLAACTTQQQTLPTLIPTATVPATAEAPIHTATPEPTRRIPPTFPPTWTPVEAATATPAVAVETESGSEVQFVPPTALEVCTTLVEDIARNARSFALGTAPQIFWIGVQGAATYHVALVEVNLATEEAEPQEIFADFTSETTYTFPAELFEAGKFYGWEVYPVDGIGQQMCQSIGAELFPTGQ